MAVRYRLDSSWRRPGDGQVLVAGSPLRLFRLSTGGAQVTAMLEVGEAPDTAAIHQLFDRFVVAGALHPVYSAGPFTAADVTVVVPAYGDVPEQLVQQLVDQLSASGAARLGAVIVVDDASPAPISFHVMVPASFSLSRHDVNRGPGGARNTGLAAVVTPLVAFVDTDVVLSPGWLEPLLAHFADPQVALVAPRVVGLPGSGRLAAYEERHSPLDLGPEPARVAAGTRVSYVPAAALVCRVDVMREVGGFVDSLRFGEDVDLVWRLADGGHRCRYEPDSVVQHRARPTLRSMLRQRFGYGRSAAPLAARHPGALAPVRMSGWSAATWLLLAMRRPLLAGGVAVGTTAALVRKLHDLPPSESARLAGLGHLAAGRQFASAVTRVWWPVALLAAIVLRRARLPVVAALVGPALYDAARSRSTQPLVDAPLSTLDQMAYGAGVWTGVLAERNAGPLLPEFTNWPPRGGG